MAGQPEKRRPDRPRDPGKRAALIVAARQLFLDRGVSAVTMDDVLSRAGVSRATLYSNFANKNESLAAVIDEVSHRIATIEWAQANLDRPLEEVLTCFGQELLPLLAKANTLAFERLIAEAALANPEYGPRFFAAGPGHIRRLIMSLIEAAQGRGELSPCDPQQAANDLLALWEGFWRLELQYGQRTIPERDEFDWLASHGVRQFLKLYGTPR